MSGKLKNPALPAGAVVEHFEDGGAIRNDGVRLKPANENPWYVLATVYGEQDGEGIDWELNAKNRRIWNGWVCQAMSADEVKKAAEQTGLEPKDLAPLTDNELADLKSALAQRMRNPDLLKFGIIIDLSETHFSHTVVWEKCVFSGDANFGSSTFSGFAYFDSSTFSGDAYFYSSAFSGYTYFTSSTFSRIAYFGSSTFSGNANFGSSTFSGYVDFSDGVFEATTSFKDATFKGNAPKFFQHEFHQDTTFTPKQSHWPDLTENNAEGAKNAYTRLALAMRDLNKPDDEHFFFRQEMRAKAVLEGFPDSLVIKGYGLLSDFGYSVMRPVGWLGLTVYVGLVFIARWLRQEAILSGQDPLTPAPLGEALGISIGNTLPFLGFVGKMHKEFYDEAPAWLDALSGVQSFMGVVLLFFVGLGLRNRFRLK